MHFSGPRHAWRLVLAFLALCCVAYAPAHADGEKPTLTIAADIWCPINCDPNAQQLGIGIDLAKRIFSHYGYDVKYVVMPWAKALEEVRAGRIDAVIGANPNDDHSLVFPENPICEITDDFYVASGDKWRYNLPDSLQGKRVGVVQGYGYGDIVTNYIQKNTHGELVQPANGDDALPKNIEKLLAGKLDIVVESKPIMDYRLRQKNLTEKVIWAGGIRQGFIYLAFSPKLAESAGRAKQYDDAIEKLKAHAKLEPMYLIYGMHPL